MSLRRTTIRPHQATLRLAAAVASLLALGLLGPAKAEAGGCGRHVAPSSGTLALVDGLLRAPVAASELGTAVPRKAPCSGPQCSEGRRRESPAPSPVDPTPLRKWGDLTTRLPVPPPPTAAAVPTVVPILRPLDLVSRPERPPRPFA